MRRGTVAVAVGLAVVLGGCGSGGSTAPGTAAATKQAAVVWLCRPGLAGDPCTTDETATVVGARGSAHVQRTAVAAEAPIDCFYVYPTVSLQTTVNANLRIDPQERAVAIAQASRFSAACRVFAPMYPQLTLRALFARGGITLRAATTAYRGVAAAFADYLARYNHGRGIVLIGHSQGAFLLTALVQRVVGHSAALRRRLVSALLLGGNVTGFAGIPPCRSTRQLGCVVAYSSFSSPPPAASLFGRPSRVLNPFAAAAAAGKRVVCVNPAAPGGGSAPLFTYFPVRAAGALGLRLPAGARVSTPWVAYPGEYVAHCASGGGADWLEVERPGGAADPRPELGEVDGPAWGLHLFDVNLALGNLVGLVRAQGAAYVAARG